MAVFKANELYAGRYLLEKLVGEGGFSEVWKARDTMANEAIVALKIYAPEKGLEEFGIKQFRKEYSITHHLTHPNLMKVFHFDIADRSPYLIMPYYKAGSLSNLLFEHGTLNEKQIALFMYQVGGALEELHSQEPVILHQDIKPDNILIQDQDHFILTDFGISSQTRHTLSKSTGSFKSLTIAYAPPERFDRNPGSNEASDVFSLGVTLYEICTGQVPWNGNGGQSLLQGAQVPDLPSKFPRELNRMVQACMSLDSSVRPTAKRIKQWGKFYLANFYWKFEDDENKKPLPLWIKVGLAGLALLLVLGVAGFFYFRSTQGPIAAQTHDTIGVSSTLPSSSDSGNPMNTDTSVPVPSTVVPNTDPVVVPNNDPVSSNPQQSGGASIQQDDNYPEPKDLPAYLNQISNPQIPRKVRKEWKTGLLSKFASGSVLVLDRQETLSKKYTISELVNILLDIPHKVKVEDMLMNGDEKITELHIKMTSI